MIISPRNEFTPLEAKTLNVLENAVRRPRALELINDVVRRIEPELTNTDSLMCWEPLDLSAFGNLPNTIKSSWVFILKANTTSGAERHPNSHQRMVSFRGVGDFQVRRRSKWYSRYLVSEEDTQLTKKWISIPKNVWHQGVVGPENWVVVSFHTVLADELIEERPTSDNDFVQTTYI